MSQQTTALFLLPETPGIICLVGSGGKTSLMFQLARELVAWGQRVLTTTTTKIFSPSFDQSPQTEVTKEPLAWLEANQDWTACRQLTLAQSILPQNKLQGFQPETIEAIWASRRFDCILVEADGARGRPLKAPAEHEPVIPKTAHGVIAVVGLQGLHRPLSEEWCFRPDIFSVLSGRKLGEPVTLHDLLRVLIHPSGITKGTPPQAFRSLFLNQADDARLRELGRYCGHIIKAEHPDFFQGAAMGTLKNQADPGIISLLP